MIICQRIDTKRRRSSTIPLKTNLQLLINANILFASQIELSADLSD